jgi:hypothetical protein
MRGSNHWRERPQVFDQQFGLLQGGEVPASWGTAFYRFGATSSWRLRARPASLPRRPSALGSAGSSRREIDSIMVLLDAEQGGVLLPTAE